MHKSKKEIILKVNLEILTVFLKTWLQKDALRLPWEKIGYIIQFSKLDFSRQITVVIKMKVFMNLLIRMCLILLLSFSFFLVSSCYSFLFFLFLFFHLSSITRAYSYVKLPFNEKMLTAACKDKIYFSAYIPISLRCMLSFYKK